MGIGDGFEAGEQHKLCYVGDSAVEQAVERQFDRWAEHFLTGELSAIKQSSPSRQAGLRVLLSRCFGIG